MKILVINKFWYNHGGADLYALWLVDELKRRGHEVCVFSTENSKNAEIEDPHALISGVETSRMNPLAAPRTIGRMFWSFEARSKLAKFIEEQKPDIAHVHNVYTQMSPSIFPVLKAYNIPVVCTVHDYGMTSANYSLFDKHGIDRVGSFWSVIRRRGVKNSWIASVIAATVFELHKRLRVYEKGIDRMLFTSDFVRKLFQARRWRGEKGSVIPLAFDLPENMPARHDKGYFLFVGRLHKTKGVHVLIEAARKTGARVKIIGDGPDRREFERQAGAMTNVEFLGRVEHKKTLEYMSQARACVVPSIWWEPFGLVALEPQSMGVPVIASNIGGLAEVVVHEQTGLQVPPKDIDALAIAIERLAKDPDEAKKLGELAKRRVETQYSTELHMVRLESVYNEITKG